MSKSKTGSLVGIETEDDVVLKAKYGMGNSVREQDKHSISSNIPFGNHSKDLWNTLNIWLKAIMEHEVDVNLTEFHLVTNKNVDDGLVVRLSAAQTQEEAEECIVAIRDIAQGVPSSIVELANKVCLYSDYILAALIKKIVLCDGHSGSYGDQLEMEVKSLLLIPEEMPFEEIYNSLLGWVHYCAMNCWRNDKPAWLSRDIFAVYYQRLLSRYKSQAFNETTKNLIPIEVDDHQNQYNKLFVSQLYLLALEKDDDLLIDAIDDYLRSITERTRLSIRGEITKDEIDKFDQNLLDRWKLIFAEYKRKYKREQVNCDDVNILGEDLGLKTLVQTLDHREPLAGQQTEQYYLTRGSYHRLANKLKIGWHPDYKIILNNGD
ncbi:ABC-three component system protein [Paenibacillus sp. TAF43_2]